MRNEIPAPLVSVITVVKNGEKYLQRTIDSIAAQTYPRIEYIVIDGKSTDGTLQIIRDNEEVIDLWKSEEDRGISDAFNKGLEASRGELIGILNADDWYEADAVQNVMDRYEDGGIFYGNNQFWKNERKDYCFKADYRLLHREMTVNHPAVFVKKIYYDRFGCFDVNYRCAMDYEMLLRFYTADVPYVYIDKVLANMQLDGISHVHWKLGFREVKAAKRKWLKSPGWKIELWYFKQVCTIYMIRMLQRIGLDVFVRLYRKHLARIPKTK